jgi:hypothetical protein
LGSASFIKTALLFCEVAGGQDLFSLRVFLLRRHGGNKGVVTSAGVALRVLADDIREEWRLLWLDRIDDKVRAEGMANRCFSLLSVERGTVIAATRAFKPLDLREILRSHNVQDVDRVISPCPLVGGWRKFARTVLNKQARARRLEELMPSRGCRKNLQAKKGGRGWLHKGQ